MRTQQKREALAEGDFEKMFGTDIDRYLEGSDFDDLDEYDKLSQASDNTRRNDSLNNTASGMRVMEDSYLQRYSQSNVDV